MCGFGITLGKKKPPAPQAANDFAKAIISDLQATESKKKGKRKTTSHPDDIKAVAWNQGAVSGWNTREDKVDTPLKETTQTPAVRRQVGAEELDDDSTILQATNANEGRNVST